jgi:hypothetical protein
MVEYHVMKGFERHRGNVLCMLDFCIMDMNGQLYVTLSPREAFLYRVGERLGRPQSSSTQGDKEIIPSALAGNRIPAVQSVVCCFVTDVTQLLIFLVIFMQIVHC